MRKRATIQPWLMLAVGLSMGLLVAAGVLIGMLATIRLAAPFGFPEGVLNATATHGGTTMAIATGPIDEGHEGLFVLDFITGELQCSVLNPRNGQIAGMYRYNVVGDLGVEPGKQARYLMVTGHVNFRYGGGNVRPAQSVVYVADENTGNFAAYMLPWNRAAAQYNAAQASPMQLLGKGTARTIQLE